MSAEAPNFDIIIPIYEGVDLMDVAAPYELFSWLASSWTEKTVTLTLVAASHEPVKSRDKLILTPNRTFKYYWENDLQADLIWVPGGAPSSLHTLMLGGSYLDFIIQQSEGAQYVTSVCEGALLLAAAGLLKGYKATTHWAFYPCLESFCDITVVPDYPRFVVDGNRVTGGGISSGLDEALEIIKMIAGEDMAQQVQLNTQYYPQPPVSSTIPGPDGCPVDLTGVNLDPD
jgi:transcriptional regulator GlxA family with amidase domain